MKVNNERIRFLSRQEAERLLAALQKSSRQLHDIALISLHCGLRAGEVFALGWDWVDFERETLLLVDTKNGRTRAAFMSPGVKAMLEGRNASERIGLIFRNRKGEQIREVSAAFARVVNRLGENSLRQATRTRVIVKTGVWAN